MSLAILFRLTAIVFRVPWNSTSASWVASDSNLLGAVVKVKPVSLVTALAGEIWGAAA